MAPPPDGRGAAVGLILAEKKYPKLGGPLAVLIELYPPDRRRIDVDNRPKAILDSLKRREKDKKQIPGAWIFAEDDSQVKDLRTILRDIVPGGKVVVTISKFVFDDCPSPMGGNGRLF